MGFKNITILDISQAALDRARKRLGEKASHVQWICEDIRKHQLKGSFDLWHDRATFHFMVQKEDKDQYVNTMTQAVNGHVIIGAFSTEGPNKCSGLDVQQYDEQSLNKLLTTNFTQIKCKREEHLTPSGVVQDFIFCVFKKR